MTKTTLAIFLAFTCFLFPTNALAKTITVNPGSSLASAITTNSVDGDIINVNPGTYDINELTVSKSNLTIQSQGAVKIIGGFILAGNYNTVRGFEITDSGVKVGIRTTGDYNLVEGNEIHHMKEDAMWLFGRHNVIRGNWMHDMLTDRPKPEPNSDAYHEDCFMIFNAASWAAYTVDDILIDRNICALTRDFGSNQFNITNHNEPSLPVKNIVFTNNVFISYNPGYVPLAFYGDSTITGVKILNNTFYNVSGQGADAVYLSNMPEVQIANNVAIGYSSIAKTVSGTSPKLSNNLVGPSNLEDYRAYSVTRNANGLFTVKGFHPLSGSSLIDKGISLTSLGVTKDFDGNLRPQGSTFDIGAFEYMGTAGGSISTPAPVTTPSPTPAPIPGDAVDTSDTSADQVNLEDYKVWAFNYLKSLLGNTSADFNNSGKVDGVDYVIWALNYDN